MLHEEEMLFYSLTECYTVLIIPKGDDKMNTVLSAKEKNES